MRAILRAAIAACLLMACAWPAMVNAADTGGPMRSRIVTEDDGPRWHRTGFYVGAVGGYDIAQLEAEGVPLADRSLMAGVLAGGQMRINSVVVGIEADFLLTDVAATVGDSAASITASTRYLASVRGRVGIALGPALFFVSAGPAFTQTKLSVDAPVDGSAKEFQTGAVFGGGVDAHLTRNLVLRFEALHYIFPDKDWGLASTVLDAENQQTTVRAGLVFNLN